MSRKVKIPGFDATKDGDERRDPAYFPNMTFAPDSFKFVGTFTRMHAVGFLFMFTAYILICFIVCP
jgi:hypothetical protein